MITGDQGKAMTDRLVASNKALADFADESRIERRPSGLFVVWKKWNSNEEISRRWHCRSGQDFYPTWSQIWPHGGTACTALSQLVRWIREQPVLPISSWRYWASERVKLCKPETSLILLDAGYPEHAQCVLCGEVINGSLDWWHLDGVSGPCCGWTSGCRQRPEHKAEIEAAAQCAAICRT